MVSMFENGTQNYRSMGESILQGPPLGRSHYSTFQRCACLNISHFKFLKKFHNIFVYYVRI